MYARTPSRVNRYFQKSSQLMLPGGSNQVFESFFNKGVNATPSSGIH
jgi:hypothetical protein